MRLGRFPLPEKMPSVSWDSSLGYSAMLPDHWMPQTDPMTPSFWDFEVKNGIQAPYVASNSEMERFRHKSMAVNELQRSSALKKTGGVTVYGYRHYSPKTGQFLRRDPIQERGGMNLYGFVTNNGVNVWDLLGMADILGADREYVESAKRRSKDSREAVLRELNQLSNKYKAMNEDKYKKLGDSIEALVKDLEKDLNAHSNAGWNALFYWKFQPRDFDSNLEGHSTCNFFVNEALEGYRPLIDRTWPIPNRAPHTSEWFAFSDDALKDFEVVYQINVTFENKQEKEVIKVEKRKPRFGDALSYPGHIGIYLGHNICVSSTAGPGRLYPHQNNNQVLIKPVNEKLSRKFIVHKNQ
jgi:RHS repeat-associated protein